MKDNIPVKFNKDICHHIDTNFIKQIDLEQKIYKYFPLKFIKQIISSQKMRLYNVNTWEDVYENFLMKEKWFFNGIEMNNSKIQHNIYGQSWTTLRESDAMWRIYSKIPKPICNNEETAVRIKTTPSKIILSQKPVIGFLRIYNVVYMSEQMINDWITKNSPMNVIAYGELLNNSLYIKRLEFEHEQEIRVTFQPFETKTSIDYYELTIEPGTFFEEFTIDPRLSKEKYSQIKNELLSLGIDEKLINQSDLYSFKQTSLHVNTKEPGDFEIIRYKKDGTSYTEKVYFE